MIARHILNSHEAMHVAASGRHRSKGAWAMAMNTPVVGINIYSVPKGKEEEFFQWWQDMRDTLMLGSGVVTGRLHRNFEADAQFNFINVAEWENELYSTIYRNHAERMQLELKELGTEMIPGLFGIASSY
jgi:heme oxygenase (mycobilin-producing)